VDQQQEMVEGEMQMHMGQDTPQQVNHDGAPGPLGMEHR
tara:strand:- start:189 stop:305 length:117 start_codon:yes stop_codon:yes gene_type:complete